MIDQEMWICRVQETIVAGPALPVIAVAAMVASTAMAAYSANQQGEAASAQAKYQQEVSQNNAILAQRAQVATGQQATVTEQQQAAADAQLRGKEAAALAGNGEDVNSGSALDITADSKATAQFNQLQIQHNSEDQQYAEAIQADSATGQAGVYGAAASNDLTAGTENAAGSVLGGAASVAGKWYQFNQAGGNNNGS